MAAAAAAAASWVDQQDVCAMKVGWSERLRGRGGSEEG